MIIDVVMCDDYQVIYINKKFDDFREFYIFSEILEKGVEIGESLRNNEEWNLIEHEVDWNWLHELGMDNWPENFEDVKVL